MEYRLRPIRGNHSNLVTLWQDLAGLQPDLALFFPLSEI